MAYSAEEREAIQDRFCRAIASGSSMRKACKLDGMPHVDTINEWLYDDADFSEQYARARERRADARSERIDDICLEVKEGSLKADAARVIIDAEKWQAGKENSKRYGDKIDVSGNLGVTLDDDQLDARIAQLAGKAGVALAARGEGTPEGSA